MSEEITINLVGSIVATKFGNKIEILDREDDQIIILQKQDLLDMLKLFEEQGE